MVKADILHELYEACKEINIDEADDIVVATNPSLPLSLK